MVAGKVSTQGGTAERQAALVSCMLSEPDLYAAARKVGVSERTAARWWKAGLRERVAEVRNASHEEALGVLRGLANESARIVGMALAKEAPKPEERLPERLPVAQKHLELLLRLRDSDTRREDLAIRREELALRQRQADAEERKAKAGEGLLALWGKWASEPGDPDA